MPQLVGSSCCRCQGRIVSILDGDFCPECSQPVHYACRVTSQMNGQCRIYGTDTSRLVDRPNVSPGRSPQTSSGLFSHLFSMQGRTPRSVYFMHTVLDGVVGLLLSFAIIGLVSLLGPETAPVGLIVIAAVVIAMSWSEIAVTVRRLHDLNRAGSQFILLLVPLVNIYMQVILVCRRGTVGDNQYGPDPVAELDRDKPPGERLLEEGTRHEINGDWDLAFDCYKAAAESLAGEPDEEYAINCIKQLQEKMALGDPSSEPWHDGS